MSEILRLAEYASVVKFSDGKYLGTSLGRNRKGKVELIVYRMGFLGLPTKDHLLHVEFTSHVFNRIITFLDDTKSLGTPIKPLTNYLANANSINEARTFCSALEKYLLA